MDTLVLEQLRHDLPFFDITRQGSEPNSRQRFDRRIGDDLVSSQRTEKKKLSLSRWARLLGVAFTSLGAAYFLLLCFRFIESAKQWSPPTRSLAAHQDRSCPPGNVRGIDAEGDYRATSRCTEDLVQQRSEDCGLLQRHQSSILQRAAEGAQDEVDNADAVEGKTPENVAAVDSATSNLKDFDLHLWANGNMPVEEEERLMHLFRRMLIAVRVCRSLLPALTCRQRIQLTFRVARLVALDLGAASIVNKKKEGIRKCVGSSLVHLIKYLLGRVGEDGCNKKHRHNLENLIVLINELKQPRQDGEEHRAEKYKKKMLGILATAEMVLKNCLRVLDGLALLRENTSAKKLPPQVVEQQLNVMKWMYDVHADHIARDGCLRAHIIECQKRTRVFALLDRECFSVATAVILPLKELQNQITEAIRAAGGLLPSQQTPPRGPSKVSHAVEGQQRKSQHGEQSEASGHKPMQQNFVKGMLPSDVKQLQTREHDKASRALEGQAEVRTSQQEEQREPSGHNPLWRNSVEGVLYYGVATSAASKGIEIRGSSPVTPPPRRLDWLTRQGTEAALQQTRTPTFPPNSQDRYPEFVPPHEFPSPVGLSIVWSQAAREGVLGQSSSLAQTSLGRTPHQSSVEHVTRLPHSVTSQHATVGRSADAHLVPATSPSPLDLRESSGWLQPPAPSHEEYYSLFGGGGVPPWSPFSKAPTGSTNKRIASRGWWSTDGGESPRHPMTFDHHGGNNSLRRYRNRNGRE
ncbi:hypothetical protein, conserved [Eimeria tenella]|uniref:Transmembrane protein n=1 Tax=Eimeria tenella TaxID=5802 RepID=C8TDV6_EIMTE|nr:hypothetical protein, conserved [Eimeria tenella]CAK51442.1 hypothetical protein e2017b09.tmp0075 [Eimeria tenella]CDJ42449.1 hypothetical protein, conserved [Eimeria tenella]|eukprot:XP_013233199.1 hypothetical protein, conserved [Eimeria tenella]